MAKIIARDNGGGDFEPFEPLEAGSYIARCYQMIEIGHILAFKDDKQTTHKVLLGFELPEALHEFKKGEGQKPWVVSKEFTLSMNSKANLRKFLEDWRGLAFKDEEAEEFELTALIGKPCRITVKHKPGTGAKANRTYLEIAGISPLTKVEVGKMPAQVNPSQILAYDDFNTKLFESLPKYIKEKIESSEEHIKMMSPAGVAPKVQTPKPQKELVPAEPSGIPPVISHSDESDLPF